MIKSAIVGCGAISLSHVDAIKQITDAEIVAVCDIKKDKADALAEKNAAKAFYDFDEMLKGAEFDFLHICTPHYLHVPMAIKALERGINVVMEKPCAMNEAEIDKIHSYLDKARVAVCFQNRYNASVIAAKELITSGRAGNVLGARAFMTWNRGGKYYTESGWRGTWSTEGGGVLMNQSIHTLDLLVELLGRPKRVSATVANHHQKGIIEVDDTAEAYIEFESGATASFYATNTFVKDMPVSVDVVCEKVTICIKERHLELIWQDGRTETDNFEQAQTGGKLCWGSGHRALIANFYKAVSENTDFPVSYESAAVTLKLVMGIYKSAKSGDFCDL